MADILAAWPVLMIFVIFAVHAYATNMGSGAVFWIVATIFVVTVLAMGISAQFEATAIAPSPAGSLKTGA